MGKRGRLRLTLLLAAFVATSGCYVGTHYRGWRYRGGRLVDNGLLARPRYRAPFAAIPFDAPGTYTYAFSRFPGPDAAVMLATPSGPSRGALESLTTQLHVRVVDHAGRTVCDASGSPRPGQGPKQAIVTSIGDEQVTGLWVWNCVGLQLYDCDPCRLSVSVGAPDGAAPKMLLVPTLEGGGVELP